MNSISLLTIWNILARRSYFLSYADAQVFIHPSENKVAFKSYWTAFGIRITKFIASKILRKEIQSHFIKKISNSELWIF